MESHLAHFQRALCYFHSGQLHDALASLLESISIAPKVALPHNNLAVVYEHLGKIEQAQQSLRTALDLNPTNYICYFNSSSICMRHGHLRKSLRHIKEAISAQLTILGQMKKDQEMLERALMLCANNIEASFLLAMLKVSKMNYSGAVQVLDNSRQYHQNVTLLNTLIELARKMQSEYSWQTEEQFYESLEYGTFNKSVLVSAQEFSLSEQQIEKEVRKNVVQFNENYRLINQIQGYKEQYLMVEKADPVISSKEETVQKQPLFFRQAVAVQ